MRCIFRLTAIGTGLLITGTILVIAERMGTCNKGVKEMKFRHAVFVGLMQGVAICPGSLQVGIDSVSVGLISGLNREFAVKVRVPDLDPVDPRFGDTWSAPDAFRAGTGHVAR